MSEELLNDDQSHYEVSLTAGQAFLAFVLLLLSLAASFAFGLILGRGQADERLVVKKEPAVISEASAIPKKNSGRIVELGVKDDDFKTETAADTPLVTEEAASPATVTPDAAPATPPATEHAAASEHAIAEKKPGPPPAAVPAAVATPPSTAAPSTTPKAVEPTVKPAEHSAPAPSTAAVPHYAQLLSSTDQKTAESLAAKLIDKGFTSAYVERASSPKGPIYKVRVKFGSEAEARAAEPKLREFSNDVWITAK